MRPFNSIDFSKFVSPDRNSLALEEEQEMLQPEMQEIPGSIMPASATMSALDADTGESMESEVPEQAPAPAVDPKIAQFEDILRASERARKADEDFVGDAEKALSNRSNVLAVGALGQGFQQLANLVAGGKLGNKSAANEFAKQVAGNQLDLVKAKRKASKAELETLLKEYKGVNEIKRMANLVAKDKFDLENQEKLNDPNSAISKGVRELLAKERPDLAESDNFEQMTASEGIPLSKITSTIAQTARANQTLKLQQDQLELKKKQLETPDKNEILKEKAFEQRIKEEARRNKQQVLNTAQKFIDQDDIKDLRKKASAFDEAKVLIKEAKSGNQAATASLGTKLARAMGEVGVLTDADVVRYLGGVSWARKLSDWWKKGAEGELSEETLKDIQNNIDLLENAAKQKLTDRYGQQKSRLNTIFEGNIPEDQLNALIEVPVQFRGEFGSRSISGEGQPVLSDRDKQALQYIKENINSDDPKKKESAEKIRDKMTQLGLYNE